MNFAPLKKNHQEVRTHNSERLKPFVILNILKINAAALDLTNCCYENAKSEEQVDSAKYQTHCTYVIINVYHNNIKININFKISSNNIISNTITISLIQPQRPAWIKVKVALW